MAKANYSATTTTCERERVPRAAPLFFLGLAAQQRESIYIVTRARGSNGLCVCVEGREHPRPYQTPRSLFIKCYLYLFSCGRYCSLLPNGLKRSSSAVEWGDKTGIFFLLTIRRRRNNGHLVSGRRLNVTDKKLIFSFTPIKFYNSGIVYSS